MKKTQWGILGLGSTSSRFMTGISLSDHNEVVAVASRTPERLAAFEKENHELRRYDHYEALLEDDKVEAIYITLRHNDHYRWALTALQKGKAVLCEKPATISVDQTKELCALAQKNNVLFLEALKTRFMPMNAKIHELLDAGLMGNIQTIDNAFCSKVEDEEAKYLYDPLIGGILYDVGSYTLGAILDLVKSPLVSKEIHFEFKKGVDVYTKITLYFENGIKAKAKNAMDRALPKTMKIVGEKGEMTIPNFHRPTEFFVSLNDGQAFEYHDDVHDFLGEIEAVHEGIQHKAFEDKRMSHADSIQLIKLIDEIANERKAR